MTEHGSESNMKMVGIRVSGELRERMESEARERRWPLAEVIRDALEQRYSIGMYAAQQPEQQAQG